MADLYGEECVEGPTPAEALWMNTTCVPLHELGKFELKERKLLDVGCGFGESLKLAQSSGWEVHGPGGMSPWSALVASRRSGVMACAGGWVQKSPSPNVCYVAAEWGLDCGCQ